MNPQGPGVPFHISPTAKYASPQPIKSVVCAGEGEQVTVIASGFDALGRVWVRQGGNWVCKSVLTGHVREVTSLLISGAHLWSSSVDRTIRIWDMSTAQCSHVIPGAPSSDYGGGNLNNNNGNGDQPVGHSSAVTCLAGVNIEGQDYVLSGSLDSSVKIWDSTANHLATETHGQGVLSMATLTDPGGNHLLVVGLEKGNIMVRHLPSFMNLFTLDLRYTFGHVGAVRCIKAGPQNTFYTSGEDGKVFVWHMVGDVGKAMSAS